MTTIDTFPRPHSGIEAEQNLLGALIAGASLADHLRGFSADWFADPIHRVIYREIEARIARGEPTDIGTLTAILAPCSEAAGGMEPDCVLADLGGAGYLATLAACATAPVVASACRIRNAWLCRELIDLSEVVTALAFDGLGRDALDIARRRVAELTAATATGIDTGHPF